MVIFQKYARIEKIIVAADTSPPMNAFSTMETGNLSPY
jgi:hypothetical protein